MLVEKPLHAASEGELDAIEIVARKTGAVCYTAYNHRFEPHYVRMRDLIKSGALGEIYRCRMFYGNGTARLVRESAWRDRGAGVLPDLGSHLLDTARFWFGDIGAQFDLVCALDIVEHVDDDDGAGRVLRIFWARQGKLHRPTRLERMRFCADELVHPQLDREHDGELRPRERR